MVPSPPEVEAPPVVAPSEVEAPPAASPPDEPESPLHLPAPPPGTEAEVRITIGEPRLVDDEARGGPVVPEPPHEDEPIGIGEPPGVQALADEPMPASGRPRPAPVDDVPAIPLKPVENEAPRRPVEPLQDAEPPSIPARTDIQSLADDPAVAPDKRAGATWTGATWDEPPVIPPKPPDEPQTIPRPKRARMRAASSFSDDEPGGAVLADGPAAAVLRAVGSFGEFLSRCLGPLNRLERGRPPFLFEARPQRPVEASPPSPPKPSPPTSWAPELHPLAEEPASPEDEPRRPTADDRLPIIPLKPLQDGFSELSSRTRGLVVGFRGGLDRFRGGLDRFRGGLDRFRSGLDGLIARVSLRLRRERPADSSLPERFEASAPLGSPDTGLEPRVVRQAPPPLTELPALRLKPIDEPRSEQDVYDDEDVYDEEGFEGERAVFVSAIWLWTRRLVVAAVVLGLGALAAVNRDIWLPQATELSERTLTEIDERVRTGHFAHQQQQAVEEASRELPHLAPETIRLIMVSSPVRVLDPPDVFEIACDATDRGLTALSTSDAEELQTLRQEMLATLRPEDRERIREFDRARERALVFPVDVRQAVLAYARAARELPPERRERLQTLLGEAIAAGLTPAPQLTPTASAERP